MKHLSLFIASLLLMQTVHAKGMHANTDTTSSSDWGVSVGIAYSNFNTGNINDQLTALKLPTIKKNLALPNIELVLFPGRHDRAFEEIGLWGSGVSNTSNNVTLTQTVVSGDINVDYIFLKHRRDRLFAGLGIGYISYAATFTQNAPSQSFQQAMSNFSDERRIISYDNFFINIKVGYDYALNKKQSILLGARAGYRIGLNKESWDLTENSIFDSPTTTASGFWAGINVTVM